MINNPLPEWLVYMYIRRGGLPNEAYIGITAQPLQSRDGSHQMLAFRKLANGNWALSTAWANALRTYERPAFDLVVLERHNTEEAARAAEKRLIAEHKTHARQGGYNGVLGGPTRLLKTIQPRILAVANETQTTKSTMIDKTIAVERKHKRQETARNEMTQLQKAVEAFGDQVTLARHLNLTPSTVNGWVRRDSLPAWRAKQIADILK
jgi:hypothetical protein